MHLGGAIEHILYLLEIVAACFIVEEYFRWKDKRKAKLLDIGCDYCEEIKPLSRTPDKVAYLCRKCIEAYFKEHPEFTEEQIQKAKKVFRRIKRKKK